MDRIDDFDDITGETTKPWNDPAVFAHYPTVAEVQDIALSLELALRQRSARILDQLLEILDKGAREEAIRLFPEVQEDMHLSDRYEFMRLLNKVRAKKPTPGAVLEAPAEPPPGPPPSVRRATVRLGGAEGDEPSPPPTKPNTLKSKLSRGRKKSAK